MNYADSPESVREAYFRKLGDDAAAKAARMDFLTRVRLEELNGAKEEGATDAELLAAGVVDLP